MLTFKFFHKYSNRFFYISSVAFLIFLFISILYIFSSPQDYQQGVYVRIMYIHVPSAWMAIGIYLFIGLCSLGYLVWRNNFLDAVARKSAFLGMGFALITLITGALWGKPVWGTWWVWDARLTSMLILLLFYISYSALCGAKIDEMQRSDVPAIVSVVGLINIPIIKFSVNMWATLHQPASFLRKGGVAVDVQLLLPVISSFLCCIFFFIMLLILRLKTESYNRRLLRIHCKKINN